MVNEDQDRSGARQRARVERLKASLRENLKRRKQQAKGRLAASAPTHDSAGIVPDKSRK
jgi:hypothetical protein